jgi:hypothetical protein
VPSRFDPKFAVGYAAIANQYYNLGQTERASVYQTKAFQLRFPLDTQMQSLWLPAIKAQLALERKNPAPALQVLQSASAIELGNIQFVNNDSCRYPVYVRAEAYLAAGCR